MGEQLTDVDLRHLRRCVELAEQALAAGDEPFGSVLVDDGGTVLAEDHNHVNTAADQTAHPEIALARWAEANLDPEQRAASTVYTSGEHCAMCSAAHGWVGLGRVVYVHSSAQLTAWRQGLGMPESPVRAIPIQQVAPGVEVQGPVEELVDAMHELHIRHARRTGPASGQELYRHRDVAESFGTDAARYDRSRPSYPHALVERVVASSPGRDVLDVGVGTGIVARLFQAAGCRVVGVDADERMAQFARRGGLEVEVAKFEEWDAAGRLFDAVVAGQTWHWVEPVAATAKAASVLRPGGLLAVFWNADRPPEDLAAAFGAVYDRVAPDSLVARRWTADAVDGRSSIASKGIAGFTDTAAAAMRESGALGDPEEWRFDWERSYTKDEWLDQVPSTGDHGKLARSQLDDLLAGIGAAIDAAGGSFTMPYTTMAVSATRQ